MTNDRIRPQSNGNGIVTADLSKTYGDVVALDHVTTHFTPGAIHGLLGRNGAGKTTLMSIICNHHFPSGGKVLIDGEDPAENGRVLGRTCFIHENQRWHDIYTAGMILGSAQRFYPDWDTSLSEHLAQQFELPLGTRAGRLSRGQRSALAATIALSSQAEYTFLDEPHLGLDATARDLLYTELARTQSTHPRTFLMSTHLIDECAGLLDTVTVLQHGQVIMDAAADEATARTWCFTGMKNRADEVLSHMTVLSMSTMGGMCSAIFQGEPDENQMETLREGSTANIRHATLQELISAMGATEPQNDVRQGESA